eukprot:TRINITY_DN66969_c12_g3_i3.p1 TRINITY_DN66969_c12_g3~~TRINITY_DN66969_c12_g3_i3.p1  ORF type:complete len:278 (+),score=19.77 TRINITY_DN66969_c12_g3_i3:21-854(+)
MELVFFRLFLLLCGLCTGVFCTGGWYLEWEEDFLGHNLNSSRWNVRHNKTHCCPAERELYLKDMVEVRDGTLVLHTKHVSPPIYGGHPPKDFHYVSGWIDSEEKWYRQFGRFEVRARLPSQNASCVWPAHWLLPNPSTAHPKDVCWPVGGEIDIMEQVANPLFSGKAYGSYHWGKKCGEDLHPGFDSAYPPRKLHKHVDFQDWHVFAVEWNATAIMYMVDGYHYYTWDKEDIPQDPMYIILNTSVAPILLINPDSYPVEHHIDWVKYYVKKTEESTF